jgi:PEP-CTERM motif
MNFQGADGGVSLVPGEIYLLSLDPTTNADNTWWVRGGVPTTIDSGEALVADGSGGMQNFEGKSNPSGLREFDLAVTVPEPATLGMIGLASLGLLKRRRHQA